MAFLLSNSECLFRALDERLSTRLKCADRQKKGQSFLGSDLLVLNKAELIKSWQGKLKPDLELSNRWKVTASKDRLYLMIFKINDSQVFGQYKILAVSALDQVRLDFLDQ